MRALNEDRDWTGSVFVPEGYEVVELDEKVQTQGLFGRTELMATTRFLFRSNAERFVRRHPPTMPSYRWVVERFGFFDWRPVAYQNQLRKIKPKPRGGNARIGLRLRHTAGRRTA